MAYLPATRIRIPPLPQFVVFVDRDDGTEWVLQHAEFAGLPHISINTAGLERGALAPWPSKDVYPADSGLGLGGGVQLFVRGGRLGYEMIEADKQSPPPNTRIGVRRTSYRIVVPESWGEFPDMLAWIEENSFD